MLQWPSATAVAGTSSTLATASATSTPAGGAVLSTATTFDPFGWTNNNWNNNNNNRGRNCWGWCRG
jgi:hypothetical protein